MSHKCYDWWHWYFLHYLPMPCFALPCLGPSSYLRIRGHRLGHQGSPCAPLLVSTIYNGWTFLSLFDVICPTSPWSSWTCLRQWCHVEHVCTDCQLALHGQSINCSFLLLTSVRKRHVSYSSPNIDLLVLCSAQLIHIILLYMSISSHQMHSVFCCQLI